MERAEVGHGEGGVQEWRWEGAGGGGWDEVSVLVDAVLSKIRDRFGGNLRTG